MHNLPIRQGSLFAVAPTPMDSSGQVHFAAIGHLVRSFAISTLVGVAVRTTLGRGTRLAGDDWSRLLTVWREGLISPRLLIVAAGAGAEIRRPAEVIEAALKMAIRAAGLSVDLVIAEPPGTLRGRPDRDRLVLEYHAAIADAGLPILISYRRESMGGIAYGPEVLAQLLARREVIGVEIATIDGITTFQQVESLTRELAPAKLVITGEDRFLGYSLMCGADAAMVGIAAAYPAIVGDLLETYFKPDAARFLKRSAEVDALARPIFRAPYEGSSLRLLRTLAEAGTIPAEAAFDPWGPRPGRASSLPTTG